MPPTFTAESPATRAAQHTDNTRLEAFSDAIFGFAATLLVVSLDVPSSYEALVKNLWGFFPFALSFAALVAIWMAHRDFLRLYPLGDSRIVFLNTILLFLILFFIYPLKLLTRMVAPIFLFGRHRDPWTDLAQRFELGRPFAVTNGSGNGLVRQLRFFFDTAKQQTATAHVAASHEITREHESGAEGLEQDVDVLARRDASEQDDTAVGSERLRQRVDVAAERLGVPLVAGRDVHTRKG